MKKKLFYKTYKKWEILHIYEHIFIQAFHTMANKHGFFAGEDFEIYGTVEETGVCEIEFFYKNREVLKIFTDYLDDNINISDEILNGCIHQVCAEMRSVYFDDINLEKIKNQLMEVQKVEWSRKKYSKIPQEDPKIDEFETDFGSFPVKKNCNLRIRIFSKNMQTQRFFGLNFNYFIEYFFNFYCFKVRNYDKFEERFFTIGSFEYRQVLRDLESIVIENIVDYFKDNFTVKVKEKYYKNTKVKIYFGHKSHEIDLNDFL